MRPMRPPGKSIFCGSAITLPSSYIKMVASQECLDHCHMNPNTYGHVRREDRDYFLVCNTVPVKAKETDIVLTAGMREK